MNDNTRKIFQYPTDTPLKFWLKYWTHYIKKLCDLDDYNTQLDSPHFILNDIIAEIEYNTFKNSENRKLFKNMLSKSLKSDKVFANLYHAQCALAFKNWDNAPLYINSICRNILQSMGNYDYLNVISEKLVQIIKTENELSDDIKQEICLYTKSLITEFLCLGVDVHDIDNFLDEDGVCLAEYGKVICAEDTCYELDRNDFCSENTYYEAISERLEKRSIEDYMNNIMRYFHKQPQDGHVILRLLGLKGSINLYIQGIHIYSVDNAIYLKEPHFSKIEDPDESFLFVNIAVPISHRFLHTSINTAKTKANNIIDFLSLNIDREKELSVSKQFAVIEIDGKECGSMESVKDDIERARFYRDVESYNISNIADKLPDYLQEFDNLKNIDSKTFRRIASALHWHKKAMCSERHEDKLLYNRIAIESILKMSEDLKKNIIAQEKECNILNLVKVLCSCILSRNFFYSYAKGIYIYLIHCTQNNDNYFDLSPTLIEDAKLNLREGQKIELSYFLNNISSIIEEMNDEVYKLELKKLQTFYNDKNGIADFKNVVSSDITLIYRLRNLIVHNAVFSQYQTKLYAYKAQFICGSLIHAIRHYCNKYGLDIENSLLRIYTDCSLFESNIDNNINSMKGLC